MRSRISVILLLFLLAFSSFSFFRPVSNVSAASAASSSCPSADILRGALNPLPNSFNQLTTAGPGSGHEVGYIEDLSTTPFYAGPNNSLVMSDSLTDWYTHNAGYTVWNFNIAPGMKWSDGATVTSNDLLSYWSPQVALNSSYDFTSLHSEIVQRTIVNSSEFTFTLNQSDAHVPEEMSSYYYTNVMSPNDIALGANINEFGPYPSPGDIVSGPFGVTNYTSGSPNLVMYRNPDYNPLPKACELDISVADSTSAFVQLLVSGQVDFAGPLDPSQVGSVITTPNMHIWEGPGLGINPLGYNVSSYPFNMTQFRQAIAYSINYTQMVQAQSGFAVNAANAEGTVSPATGLYNPNIQPYSYNPTKALALLSEIGITKGTDGLLHYPNGTAVSFTIFTSTNEAYFAVETGDVQRSLENLGMTINTQVIGIGNLIGDLHTNGQNIDHNMFIQGGVGDVFQDPWIAGQPPCDVYLVFCLSQNTVTPASAQAEYMGNLTALDQTDNFTQEAALLNNIQSIYAQNLPSITLSYPDIIFAYSTSRFTNWQANNSTNFFAVENHINKTTLATVTPVGLSGSSSTTSHVSSTSSGVVSTGTTSLATTNTSSKTSLSLAIIAAVLVVVAAAGVLLGFRSRGRRPP